MARLRSRQQPCQEVRVSTTTRARSSALSRAAPSWPGRRTPRTQTASAASSPTAPSGSLDAAVTPRKSHIGLAVSPNALVPERSRVGSPIRPLRLQPMTRDRWWSVDRRGLRAWLLGRSLAGTPGTLPWHGRRECLSCGASGTGRAVRGATRGDTSRCRVAQRLSPGRRGRFRRAAWH